MELLAFIFEQPSYHHLCGHKGGLHKTVIALLVIVTVALDKARHAAVISPNTFQISQEDFLTLPWKGDTVSYWVKQ